MDRAYIQTLADEPDRDQVVVLHNVSWAQYEALLEARGERHSPKMAFLDGELELMTKSLRHELGKKLLARLVECWAEERSVELIGAGETTFRRKLKKAGLEPDECYWVDRMTPYPDLARGYPDEWSRPFARTAARCVANADPVCRARRADLRFPRTRWARGANIEATIGSVPC